MTQHHVLIYPTTTTAGFERHLTLLVQTVPSGKPPLVYFAPHILYNV